MATFTFVWKIRGGDVYEREFREYKDELEAIDDWEECHAIDMNEVEWVNIEEK